MQTGAVSSDPSLVNNNNQSTANPTITNLSENSYYPNDLMHGLLAAHTADEVTGIVAGKSNVEAGSEVNFNNYDSLREVMSKKGIDINEYVEGWKVLEVITDKQTGYLGIIYINENNKQLVLAHRSTNFKLSFGENAIKNFKFLGYDVPYPTLDFIVNNNFFKQSGAQQNVEGILLGTILMHQAYGYLATNRAVELLKDIYKDFSLSFAGHSLGAWLAELSTFYCATDLQYPNVKSVTFDGPGSYEMMEQMSKSNINGPGTRFNIDSLNNVAYLSAVSVVNSCNKHPGTVKCIYPDIKVEGPAIIRKTIPNIQDATLATVGHMLEHILPHFSSDTGKPTEAKRVIKWPSYTHKQYGQNDHNSIFNTLLSQGIKAAVVDGLIDKPIEILTTLINYVPVINLASPIIKPVVKTFSYYAGPTAASFVAKKIIGSEVTTLSSLVYLMKDLYNKQINQEQFWIAHEHLDRPNGYRLKETDDPLKKFSSLYQGNVQVEDINDFESVVSSSNAIDSYLIAISKLKNSTLDLIDSSLLRAKLLELKGKYIYHSNIKTIKSKDTPIDDLRDTISNLVGRQNLKSSIEKANEYEQSNESSDQYLNFGDNLPSFAKDDFIERNIFDEIDKALYIDTNKVFVVYGISGSGKSSIALEYAHRFKINNSGNVFWFEADMTTSDKIDLTYRNLAEKLNVNTDNETIEKIVPLVNAKLLQTHALFIFDNVTDYQALQKYLIGLPVKVKILITANSDIAKQSNQKYVISKQLEPFTEDEAIKYLTKNSRLEELNKNQQQAYAKEIIKKIGLLPYYLAKAKACLTSPEDIRDILDNISKENIGYYLIDILISKSPLAWQLLQYLSYLDPDFIPKSLIIDILGVDEDKLNESINILKSLSLVTCHDRNDQYGLQIHRLAQNEAKEFILKQPLKCEPSDKILISLLTSLDKHFPEIKWFLIESQKSNTILNHTRIILDTIKLDIDCCNLQLEIQSKLYHMLGRYYIYVNMHEDALELSTIAYNMRKKLYGDQPNLDTAASLHNIGVSHRLTDTSNAIDKINQAFEIRKKVHENNPCLDLIAQSQTSLGDAYCKLGGKDNIAIGINYQCKALKILKDLYEDSDIPNPDIVQSIIVLLQNCKNLKDDKIILMCLENSEAAFGTYRPEYDDILTLRILYNIFKLFGEVYCMLDETDNISKGIEMLYRALEKLEILVKNQQNSNVDLNIFFDLWHKIGINHYIIGDINNICIGLKTIEGYFPKLLKKYGSTLDQTIAVTLNNIGIGYEKLGDKAKAAEYFKQAYLCSVAVNLNSSDIKENALSYSPKLIVNHEQRIILITRGKFDNDTLNIKLKIQSNILNKIHYLAKYDQWHKGYLGLQMFGFPITLWKYSWGIKGYVNTEYVKNELGDLATDNNIKITQGLYFEAICLGIMSQENKEKNLSCAIEFAKAYPELVKDLSTTHPEYFVDGRIVKALVQDPEIVAQIIGGNSKEYICGEGTMSLEHNDKSSYWNQYTKVAVDKILQLRLDEIKKTTVNSHNKLGNAVKLLDYNYIWNEEESANNASKRLIVDITSSVAEGYKYIILPLSIGNKHWVGIAIANVDVNNIIQVTYIDSQQQQAPISLKQALLYELQDQLAKEVLFTEASVNKQTSNNCGPEMIENFMAYLTGERIESDFAVSYHSQLVEQNLAGESTMAT